MRSLLYVSSIVVLAVAPELNAQIRTPIATEPLTTTAPGPAPYNAKGLVNSPTSVTVSWDGVGGTKAYTVDRTRTDDAACCVAHSGLITTPSWTDTSLEAGKEYSFVITALYSDGRVGSTEVVAAMPMPELPAVRVPKSADMSSAEGVLRLTPCGQRSSGGPGPATVAPTGGSPAGARLLWTPVAGSGMNYVVDRAPEGTTNWILVGSTCGGPSPINVSTESVTMRDLAGGVQPNGRYVYRVTAVSSNGAAGWNTYHFAVPCHYGPLAQVSVNGSTVTVTWQDGGNCGGMSSPSPETYTLSTSFGFTKTKSAYGWTQEILYGVPVGNHTLSMVGNYRTGGSTTRTGKSFTVAY